MERRFAIRRIGIGMLLAASGILALTTAGTVTASTADTTPPVAAIRALPPVAPAASFAVGWTGADSGGSGISSYDVQVSVDGDAYTAWLTGTTSSSATFRGSAGHGYAFRVRARDAAGNIGSYRISNTWIGAPSLRVGQFLRIHLAGVRLRATPGLSGTVLAYLPAGSLGAIVGGPVYSGGYAWYRIREPLATWPPLGTTSVGWVAAASGWLGPAHAPNTTRAPVIPSVHITWPASGGAGSGPPTANVISWSSTNGASTTITEQASTTPGRNIDCAGLAWRTAWTLTVRTSALRITGFSRGYCYRYLVRVRSVTGTVASALSGTLWIYPAWRGGLNLYRSGVFATQQTMYWCLPASIEMVLNVAEDRSIESSQEQSAFYTYGRAHDFYDYPDPGLDPDGALAILGHVHQRYANYLGSTIGAMERAAVLQLRRTNKPAIVYVDGAVHAWVLNGFTATADPAATSSYTITSFSVMGPLWPIQQYYKGYYDMPPNTRLSPSAFAAAVGRSYHDVVPTPWDGTYVVTRPR